MTEGIQNIGERIRIGRRLRDTSTSGRCRRLLLLRLFECAASPSAAAVTATAEWTSERAMRMRSAVWSTEWACCTEWRRPMRMRMREASSCSAAESSKSVSTASERMAATEGERRRHEATSGSSEHLRCAWPTESADRLQCLTRQRLRGIRRPRLKDLPRRLEARRRDTSLHEARDHRQDERSEGQQSRLQMSERTAGEEALAKRSHRCLKERKRDIEVTETELHQRSITHERMSVESELHRGTKIGSRDQRIEEQRQRRR